MCYMHYTHWYGIRVCIAGYYAKCHTTYNTYKPVSAVLMYGTQYMTDTLYGMSTQRGVDRASGYMGRWPTAKCVQLLIILISTIYQYNLMGLPKSYNPERSHR
jgi:hypothetical protein